MTPMEAWNIISANLANHHNVRRAMYPNDKGYTDADVKAEVICFQALMEMQERRKQK